jgi:hypothetical protein
MKLKGHKFRADLKYTFSRYHLEGCTQCGKPEGEHADGKCLFESTIYRPNELLEFFELFMRKGGTLTLTVGTQTLTQKIHGVAIDQGANLVMGDFRSEGEAFLGGSEHAHPKR